MRVGDKMMKKTRKIIAITFVLVAMLVTANSSALAGWKSMTSGTVNYLEDVWGTSASDVYVAGWHGTILHYNGTSWSSMTSGTTKGLYGLWGSSGSDIFAVGENGTIIHYNGTNWSAMTSGTTDSLYAVWGSSATDVFAVGWGGKTIHYNGTSWSSMTSGMTSPNCIWGSSSTDVFAVSAFGIYHYDGLNWASMYTGASSNLSGVWGNSSTDVFAVGNSGIILHYDGTAWTSMTSGTSGYLLNVWGSSGSDVFAVGVNGTMVHYDGSNWSTMSSGITSGLFNIWGNSGSDVFAVGQYGIILHYDGVPVTTTSTTTPSSTTTTPSGNTAPTASFTVIPSSGDTTTPFSVDASGCSDAEDGVGALLVIWDWESDGVWDTPPDAQKTANHQYAAIGTYTITLKVEDTGGLSDTVTQQVKVITGGGSNTQPTASFTVNPSAGDTSTAFTVDASGSTDDGTVLEFHWDWESDGMWDTDFTIGKTASHTYSTGGLKTITLEVIDQGGLTDTTTLDVTVGGTSTTTASSSGYNIGGMVTGDASSNVPVELSGDDNQILDTDDTGHYEFPNLNAGGFYLIIPQLAGYDFDPPQHEIPSLMGDELGMDFIATKTCPCKKIYEEESEEVELLRYFRDNVLSKSPEGRELIKLYYQWSPVIVKVMEADEDFKEDMKGLIDGVLELIGEVK